MSVPEADEPKSVPPTRRSLLPVRLMRLEERIVLDAAAGADTGADGDHADTSDQDTAEVHGAAHDSQPASPGSDAPTPLLDSAQDALARTIEALLSPTGGDSAAKRILVVSADVEQANALAGAAAGDVAHTIFHPQNTTLDGLLEQIRAALEGQSAESIALATHGRTDGGFELLDGHAVTLESLQDPTMQAFWRGLAALVSPEGRIDLLACDAAAGPHGAALVDALEDLTGVNFAASTDETGNAEHGGNWVLESDQIAVGALYFDAYRLKSFGQVLDDQPTLTDTNPGQTAIGGHLQGVVVDPNISVTDPNVNDNLQGATVRIRAGFNPAQDSLTYDTTLAASLGPSGILGSYDPATGILLLKNPGTAAEYQQLLRTVRYVNSDSSPDTTPREIFFTIGDSYDAIPGGYNPETGHYYKMVNTLVDWTTARDNAAASNLGGLAGYLATLTTTVEDTHALTLFIGGGAQDAWLGGSDSATEGAVEGTWYWVTGPEAGTEFWPTAPPGWMIAKWGGGQPDDAGNSDYLVLYRGMPPIGPKDWRDEPGGGSHRYLIEYGGMDSDVEGALTASVMVNVAPPNSAPVLDPTGSMYLPAISEDPTTNPGSTVASIIASAGGDRITDADADPEGIAIIGIDGANGTWQFSTDGGVTWQNVGAVTSANALLLRDSDLLRFQPNTDWNGVLSSGITFRAWDQTDGTAGGYLDATVTGGEAAVSAASETASIRVDSVSDAPVLDDSSPLQLNPIDEDDINNAGTRISDLLASLGTDALTDGDAGASEGIALIGLDTSHGMWQYSVDGGTTWLDVGSVSDGNALLLRSGDLLRFQPDADWNGTLTSAISFRGWDQTSGSAGDYADATLHGGTSAFSAAAGTATLVVNSKSDAPIVAAQPANQVAFTGAAFAHQLSPGVFTDADAGDVLTYSATLADGSPLPAWLVFDPVTRTFSGTPGSADVGSLAVRVTAKDAQGESASADFILTVDTLPVVIQPLGDRSATVGQAFLYQFGAGAFADADPGDTLVYTATLADGSPLPAWLLFDPLTRTFSGMPGAGDVGALDVKVTAEDGHGGSVSDIFSVQVMLGPPTQPGGGTTVEPPPHTGGSGTIPTGDGGSTTGMTPPPTDDGGGMGESLTDPGASHGDAIDAGDSSDVGESVATSEASDAGATDSTAPGLPLGTAGLGQAAVVADNSGTAAPAAAHRDEVLLLGAEHLTTQLQTMIFSGDLLGNEDRPIEFNQAWNAILSAYAESGEELTAYLQSAFRTVTESACIYQDAQHALGALHEELELAREAGVHLDVEALLARVDEAQRDVRLASAQLESAIQAAAQAGTRNAFDRVLEDVISAALERLMEANQRLFIDSRALVAATALLREARSDPAIEADASALAARVSAARTAAHDRLAELRASWDRVAQDVLAAFVARLAGGKVGEAPPVRMQ